MTKIPARRESLLGWGPYQRNPDDFVRSSFLLAVRRIKPGVLASLEQLAIDAFAQASAVCPVDRITTWAELVELAEHDDVEGRLKKLHDAVSTWGNRWRLDSDWCLDAALVTLSAWHHNAAWRRAQQWQFPPSASFVAVNERDRQFSFEDRGWQIDFESWETFMGRVRRDFEAELADYRLVMEATAKRRGLVATDRKRTRIADDETWRRTDHFAWIARVHLDDESGAAIAHEAGYDSERTVQMQVAKLYKLLGLTRLERPN